MLKLLLIAAAGSTALGFASSAAATTLHFYYAESGGYVFGYDQSSDPTPNSYNTNLNTTVPVSGFTSPSVPTATSMIYANGNFYTGGVADPSITVYAEGPQIYSGSEAAPIFSTGKYTLFDISDSKTGVLHITAGAPEPSTWAIMLLGIGAMGVGLRRRAARAIA
jgi:PEP-CTERM motif